MREHTVALLKPEAVRYAPEIRRRIANIGLMVVGQREYRWDFRANALNTIQSMYPRCPEEIVEATVDHYLGHATPVLLLEGKDAIRRFFALAGKETNPGKCHESTLRRQFGIPNADIIGGRRKYWRNALHRPRDANEAIRDIRIFF
ncbi:MAG: nucleoside-diphosphate kinase [bacterium]